MDTTAHTLSTLFEQLGLPADGESIRSFIQQHRPLDPAVPLAEAPWWSEGQVAFIQEAIEEDADWAECVDELDALLRHTEEEAAAETNQR